MLQNPMGTDGFEFVEYSSRDGKKLETLFQLLGFTPVAKHKSKNIILYRQGKINFIINAEPNSFATKFSDTHGLNACCGMAFRVKDAQHAYKLAISNGAKPYDGPTDHIGKNVKAIYGIGDSLLYLIDNYQNNALYNDYFDRLDVAPNANSVGLDLIDHLTHNVFQGQMDHWAKFYEKIFNFKEIRYFDIQGKKTGLISRALASPCNKIKIPLNESKDSNSQIEEYLREYKGEGIQHIALSTTDIYKTVEEMRKSDISFMDTPDTYYELIDKRLPNHGEDIKRMKKSKILIDGGESQGGGFLLQIFTNTVIGPIFFEIIQRKGNHGFGEGNFQALFDSIELDQIRRGVLAS